MRAGVNRAFAVVGGFAAPVNDTPFAVPALELEPDVKRVHGAAGEEVPELARADHHFHSHRVAAAELGGHTAERSDQLGWLEHDVRRARKSPRGLLTHRKRAGQLRRLASRARKLAALPLPFL